MPQWSPVDVTGNRGARAAAGPDGNAAMEPGRRDREQPKASSRPPHASPPQWSPVDVTGNSQGPRGRIRHRAVAAMEPGRRDREQQAFAVYLARHRTAPQWSPVDVTGNRWSRSGIIRAALSSRNGARST